MSKFTRTTARIAAWNLAGYNTITPERLANQVEGFTLLDAEIITLVEVKPFSHMQSLIGELAVKGCLYESVMLQQPSDLNIGVLFKKGVKAKNPRFIANSDLGDDKKRKALVVDMKVGNFDFTLIAVHLKSGRNATQQKIRDKQCKIIGDFITDLRDTHNREDVLLMGDFNMIPGEDVSNFHLLGGDDIMNFISSWDLQARFSHILPKGRANLLDGFAITRTFSREYIRGTLQLFPMHWTMDMGREKFRKEVSDHLPFVASFRIDKDKD